MGGLFGGASLVVCVFFMAAGFYYLSVPYEEKAECERNLPRNVECTYQPPQEVVEP